jgi:mannose-1-phosphate guanylyltransferase/mannose-6-phosphate isomerase
MTMDAPVIVPVIMCGGAGTRLWPLSIKDAPKPFHAFNSDHSLFQDTVLRIAPGDDVAFAPPLIVCGEDHREIVERQLAALGVEPLAIVLEPCGRNTAPVAAVAADIVARRRPGALILLLAADHQIADAAGFRGAVARAAAVGFDHIVTFGVTPSGPETGYGYIQRGAPLTAGVDTVVRFVEKPAAATAQAYLDSGDYVWNAGIFLFSPALFLDELRANRPDIAEAALAAIPAGDAAVMALDGALFSACPAESIDYAVMEHTKVAAVAACDIGWADVGSWSEVWRLGGQDEARNVSQGLVVTLDTSGSLIWSDGPVVATVGVEDLIVVAAGGAVLVLPKSRAQDVKAVVAALAQLKDGQGMSAGDDGAVCAIDGPHASLEADAPAS